MKEIGGYFELELNDFGSVFHDNAVAVNSGRNALQYILTANKKYNRIWIPYYTCDVILQPLKRLNYKYNFYNLTEDLLPDLKPIKKDEVLLYINYFGVMNKMINRILNEYKNVIIDNSQAFYSKPVDSLGSFYSPRKFFGIPDGGFAYTILKYKIKDKLDDSLKRIDHLVIRIQNGAESGYSKFKLNDSKFNKLPLMQMSLLTDRMMRNINYQEAKKRRNENFNFIHNKLIKLNELTPIIDHERINAPMVYPFLMQRNDKLRTKLIKNKIFIATYWPNVLKWKSKGTWENYLTNNLLALPIDQRYTISDLTFILGKILD